MPVEQRYDARLPERVPIDAYGNGGFRFGDMSHRGSLLALPSGMHGWSVTGFSALNEASFEPVLAEIEAIEFLLLGAGAEMHVLPLGLAAALRQRGLRVECMDTGAAARTYNILLGEKRAVAAALIAVDEPAPRR